MWVPHDIRDQLVDFVPYWSQRGEILAIRFNRWLGIAAGKFYDWKARYGKVNEHSRWIPRDFLEDWEKQAIQSFFHEHPDEGYRRLAFMMLDAGIVAGSPSSVFRVLSAAGLLRKRNRKKSGKAPALWDPAARMSTGMSISPT
jgi:putative transposase